jgi:hypothetical protein
VLDRIAKALMLTEVERETCSCSALAVRPKSAIAASCEAAYRMRLLAVGRSRVQKRRGVRQEQLRVLEVRSMPSIRINN